MAGTPEVSQEIQPTEQELTELRRLNADLERQNAAQAEALEQANRELQSLSFAISHDLRAPLRTITGFSKIVLAAGAGKLDQETLDNLGRVAAGAERMSSLIDDLLKLSRVSRMELQRQSLDISHRASPRRIRSVNSSCRSHRT